MITGTIFNKPNVAKTNLVSECTEFNLDQAMVDLAITLEDVSFIANKNQISAVHVGIKSDNVDILTEGFKDFIDKATEFFHKLIEKIKEYMKKVLMFFNSYIGDFEKFVKRYEKELSKRQPDFDIMGHKYTIDDSVPNIDIIDSMVSDFNSELSSLDTMTKKDIHNKRTDAMSEKNLDKIRGNIMGQGPITKDEYSDTLKKIYRDGDSEKSSIHVDSSVLADTITNVQGFKKHIKAVQKERDRMISLLNSIKSYFSKSATLRYDKSNRNIHTSSIDINSNRSGITTGEKQDISYTTEKMTLVNIYFNFKFAYSKEVSAMCTSAMTEKVNALKEQMKQHKTIIRKAVGSSNDISGGED